MNEGIVLRRFADLEPLAEHPKSGMPLSKEFRIFFYNGLPLQLYNYWNEGGYGDLKPDMAEFVGIAQKIPSAFFTMDIAKVKEDGWTIIELGDGQVSGLPDESSAESFYAALKVATISA